MAIILGRKGGSGGGGGAPSGPAGGVLSGTYPNPGFEITAKGNLIVGTAADTAALLTVGATNGMVLEVASGQATGVQWDLPPGHRWDYAQITAPVTGIVATTEGTAAAVVTGASVTYDGTQVRVEFYAPAVQADTVPTFLQVILFVDSTVIGRTVVRCDQANADIAPILALAYHTPSAGAHVYSAKAIVNANTAQVRAGAGGAGNQLPAYITVTKA